MSDSIFNPINNPPNRSAIAVHQGFPVESGFGSDSGLSPARNGSTESANAISTFSAFALGDAAFAIKTFSSSKVMFAGIALSSKVTAIEISSIVPGFTSSLVWIFGTPY